MTTITDGVTVIAPDLVTGYESVRAAQTIFHTVVGRAYPDVTLRPATLRTGTLTMLFASGAVESLSLAAETMHAQGAVLTLTDPDLGTVTMRYVLAGNLTRTLDPDSRAVWLVACDFQEVAT